MAKNKGEQNAITNSDKQTPEKTAVIKKENKKAENNKKAPKQKKATENIIKIAKTFQRGENETALLYRNERKGLIVNALGQFLYETGFFVEYSFLRFYRALSFVFVTSIKTINLLFLTLMRPLFAFLRGILRDLASPFIGIYHSFSRPKNEKAEKVHLTKKEVALSFLHSLKYLLPIGAGTVFVLTIYLSLSTPYSLAATQDGVFLGYIQNDTVWDEAEKTVESRVRAAHEQQSLDITPTFTLAAVSEEQILTSTQLADRIIEESSEQIAWATGIYAGDVLVAVSVQKDEMQLILDTHLNLVIQENPEARVDFVHELRLEDGLYYTESITNTAQVESSLIRGNYLQTQITVTQVREEIIPFAQETQDSELYYTGTSIISQSGINGIVNVTEDVIYIDGVEVGRVYLSEEVVREARTQITLNGTRQNTSGAGSYTGDVIAGTGTFIWPVPAYTMTTVEFGEGGHRALDIAAPSGTPIYACDTGTVTEAGWHYSWGYYVLIDHGNGITTLYAHCSRLDVAPGVNVQQGTQIGLVGNTGVSFGNHLHIEITVNGSLVNPRGYIAEP